MPKKPPKNIGTSSLKVKPKKRPGLIKQLSQPFFPSNKKNKNGNAPEPVKLISAHSRDELGLFSGFDDMFLPDSNKSDPVFMSPEKEIETFLKFDTSMLTVELPTREKCSSADSGYTSPPPQLGEAFSPTTSTPGKGILKKMRCTSPDNRVNSPILSVTSPDTSAYLSVPSVNGHNDSRPLSPVERALSPLGLDLQNALGMLDDYLELENDKKIVKKSVSFGELAEVKNFFSDSSDNELLDEFPPLVKSVSLSDVECIKQDKDTKNELNKSKKSVSFDDLSSTKKSIHYAGHDVEFDDINEDETESSSSDLEKSDLELNSELCGCVDICISEVEVKVIDIQPLYDTDKGQGHIRDDLDNDDEMDYTCKELERFNVLICHHPGCTTLNENRPMLLCKECDNHIHQRPQYSGHLVLDVPKRKTNHGNGKFMHTNSVPSLHNSPSMDIAEVERDADEGSGEGPVAMDTDNKTISKESPEMGEVEKRLKRKKVMKAKRRHTTGARSHSASDIFSGNHATSDDEETKDRYSYHGSIDENTLMQVTPSKSYPGQAFQRAGKGTINHETFTVKIGLPGSSQETEVEIVAAEKNVTLRDAIQPILERRGFDIENINVFVEASNTPLPLNCETFLLGGTTMYIKQKDGEPTLPSGTQSLSKATGSRFAPGSKGQNSKSSKSGMSRRESMINRAQSMLEAPVSKQRRSSLQLPFQAFFPSPKGEGPKLQDEASGSLRSRRGINLSIDDSAFPMALTTSISPQGTLREDNRKQKPSSKLTTLFSPLSKDKEKQEQLNELLSNYSTQGLPSPPPLMQIGHTALDDSLLEIETDWREIVESSQSLTKRQQDQQEAIWELLQTELYYIRSLRVISDVFYCVLLNLQNEAILNEIETEKLFNNISDIVTCNSEFWSCHLVRALQDTRHTARPLNPSTMKEGFQKCHEMFKPYIQYCVKQKTCTDYMKAQYQENELFKTFVIWAEAQKQCNRLKLTDLLVKPMQRLTKYSLLLQAIHSKTDDEHQRKDLVEMIANVDHFVHHVNSTLRQQHEEEKLQAIVEKIEPYDAVEAPNDECLKLIQQYNGNFNLITPMPGCNSSQTRALVMQSPLKMKEYQNRMDVECLLFTDLMLVCKASKRMDKYKIVKPPMRVDRIIIHELKDKGSFLLIYVNEYHIPVSSFTFHADQNAIQIWLNHIRKAQDLYRQARLHATADKPTFPPTEEVIEYTPLMIPENPPLLQLTRCASEEPAEGQSTSGQTSPINRSRSWNEMVSMGKDPNSSEQVPGRGNVQLRNSASSSEPQLENAMDTLSFAKPHPHVQYSQSDPTVFSQFLGGDDRLHLPHMSVSGDMGSGSETSLPEFVDENMKSKLYQRRQSRTEKRYYTADAIQEINKSQNRDNSIYKRLSWNFPNGDAAGDRQGVLKGKTMSSDSIRSFHSSSGVSSTCSLHLSPEGDICEENETDEMFDSEIEINNKFALNKHADVNDDDVSGDIYTKDPMHCKSKSTPDIVSLMRDLNTGRDMKDGIKSVDLPSVEDQQNKRLSHQQLLRMKKQLLLSSNVEASEV